MTNEEREAIKEQIAKHEDIIFDLHDEIEYHEREIINLKSILEDDSQVENTVCIRHNNE